MPASDPSPPRMLGRYAVYEKIASGGMASVHIGRLLGPVGFARTVAVKQMHVQFAEDPEFVSMFLDEARLAARIHHPNVVQTLDVVANENELFLVMDFVQGESFARLIRNASERKERIPPDIVASIMAGVLHGLHAAHEAKSDQGAPLSIVHRDVSPHNVLVGVDGVARVLDFGVAKAADRAQTTRDGQLKGKLAYMSSEQVRGEATRASDIYAAAVVLWEGLTGKRLFSSDNAAHLVAQILKGCDVPPSKYALGLPSALDAVTMRGLSVEASDRFATAREMARALEDAVALASTSKVGDWVEAAAKETLDVRSARIAAIESDSFGQVEAAADAGSSMRASHPSWASQRSPVAVPEGTSVAVTDDMLVTQISSGSVSSPGHSPRRRSRVPAWLALTTAGVLALLGVVALIRLPGKSPSTPAFAGSAAGVASESAPPAPSVAPPPSAVAAPAVTSAAPVEPAATPPATSASTAASPKPPPNPPAVRPAAPSRAPAASKCDPPYYFDSRGVRVFKTECL